MILKNKCYKQFYTLPNNLQNAQSNLINISFIYGVTFILARNLFLDNFVYGRVCTDKIYVEFHSVNTITLCACLCIRMDTHR